LLGYLGWLAILAAAGSILIQHLRGSCGWSKIAARCYDTVIYTTGPSLERNRRRRRQRRRDYNTTIAA
jgi:hypothetical protein